MVELVVLRTICFSTKFLVKVFVVSSRGVSCGGRNVRNAPLPPAIFNNVFDKYTFFIILNFLDNNKISLTPYKHAKMCKQKCIIFG